MDIVVGRHDDGFFCAALFDQRERYVNVFWLFGRIEFSLRRQIRRCPRHKRTVRCWPGVGNVRNNSGVLRWFGTFPGISYRPIRLFLPKRLRHVLSIQITWLWDGAYFLHVLISV